MGMKLGARVVLGSDFAQGVDPDMIHIEDGATVNAKYQAHTFEDRVLKMDLVHVRRWATLGSGSVPLYGADVGERTRVAPHSVIMKREQLFPGDTPSMGSALDLALYRYVASKISFGVAEFYPGSGGEQGMLLKAKSRADPNAGCRALTMRVRRCIDLARARMADADQDLI